MKINFDQELKDFDGESLPKTLSVSQCPNCGFRAGKIEAFGKLTLKSVAADALNFNFPDEGMQSPHPIDGTERARRGVLAMRIYANPTEVDLEVTEVADIKKLIGKGLFVPNIVAQAHAMLEGKKMLEKGGE